tara:strand:- start:5466 stop:5615 length:150 start_codon:yes stop_codon:yes gene_type:complete
VLLTKVLIKIIKVYFAFGYANNKKCPKKVKPDSFSYRGIYKVLNVVKNV